MPPDFPALKIDSISSLSSKEDGHGFAMSEIEFPIQELATFAGRTEGQFLSLGKALRDFHSRAGEVSTLAAEVTALMMGSQSTGSVSDLENLLQRMSVHLDDVETASDGNEGALLTVRQALETVFEPLEAYGKIVRNLQLLSFSTRVESPASREPESFHVLAADLKRLSGTIGSKVDEIVSRIERLDTLTQDAASRLTQLRERQAVEVHRHLDQARTNLFDLHRKHRVDSDRASFLSARSSDISTGIGEIVASIQFHDITRQQIEHALMALQDLAREVASGTDLHQGLPWARFGVEIAEVSGLQAEQLRHSRDELMRAGEQIVSSLENLARGVTTMGRETRTMAGVTGKEGASFLSEMEPVIETIAGVLREYQGAGEESTAAVSAVVQEIAEMSGLVEEIENIGSEMKIVALNAGIKAAHVGEQGAALGVIAGAIQSLAAEALEHTRTLAQAFQEIRLSSGQLGQDHEKVTSRDFQLGTFADEARDLLDSLRRGDGTLIELLGRLDERSRLLADDLKDCAASLTVHHVGGEILDQVCTRLDNLARRGKKWTNAGPRLVDRDLLGAQRERYTMNSEREVHRRRQQRQNAPPGWTETARPAAKKTSSSVPNTDLGDNVELF